MAAWVYDCHLCASYTRDQHQPIHSLTDYGRTFSIQPENLDYQYFEKSVNCRQPEKSRGNDRSLGKT